MSTSNYNQTIIEMFEANVEKYSSRIAVKDEDRNYTYEELNILVNNFACKLLLDGIKNNQFVGIWASCSVKSIIAVLAVMKVGATFIFLEPKQSKERLEYIISITNLSVIIKTTNEDSVDRYLEKVIEVEKNVDNNLEMHIINEKKDFAEIAYVLFTSGTTGVPKGVEIYQKGLVNYVLWAKSYYQEERYIFPLFTSLAFDLTITSVFVPLISGGQIVVYNSYDIKYTLEKIMSENKVNIIKVTPTHLELLRKLRCKSTSIKRIIVGGENFTTLLAKDTMGLFKHEVEIYNEYGPTETVVGCTVYKYLSNSYCGSNVPIGKAIDNMYVYVLNSDLEPIKQGEIGEIYIGGIGVAKGYYKQKELTEQSFINDIFDSDKKMYKSGDTAALLPDGNLVFVGRVDEQIKIHGYRVELGDIEAHLKNIRGISSAKVIKMNESERGEFLCAFIVKEDIIPEKKIRELLANKLPKYMIPQNIITVKEVPLTVNGKIDLRRLKYEYENKKTNYVGLQAKIYEVWNMVLGRNDIGVTDNFFEIGGDSFSAIMLIVRMTDRGYDITIDDLFCHPTIEELAERLLEKTKRFVIPMRKNYQYEFDKDFLFKRYEINAKTSVRDIVDKIEKFKAKSDIFDYSYNNEKNLYYFDDSSKTTNNYEVMEENADSIKQICSSIFIHNPNFIFVIILYEDDNNKYACLYGNDYFFNIKSFEMLAQKMWEVFQEQNTNSEIEYRIRPWLTFLAENNYTVTNEFFYNNFYDEIVGRNNKKSKSHYCFSISLPEFLILNIQKIKVEEFIFTIANMSLRNYGVSFIFHGNDVREVVDNDRFEYAIGRFDYWVPFTEDDDNITYKTIISYYREVAINSCKKMWETNNFTTTYDLNREIGFIHYIGKVSNKDQFEKNMCHDSLQLLNGYFPMEIILYIEEENLKGRIIFDKNIFEKNQIFNVSEAINLEMKKYVSYIEETGFACCESSLVDLSVMEMDYILDLLD